MDLQQGDKSVRNYKELLVWQRAMELACEAYAVTGRLPKEEMYALGDQIRRSAISVPSNIAEGYGRNSTRDYVRFLSIALSPEPQFSFWFCGTASGRDRRFTLRIFQAAQRGTTLCRSGRLLDFRPVLAPSPEMFGTALDRAGCPQ